MGSSRKEHNHRSIVVIGAGQAGLATSYYLDQFDLELTILAADERVGDTWRNRWDSLELFTPAFYNSLPGLEFPSDDGEYLPHKDEMADYLETYAETFDLPVELGTRVTRLQRSNGRFTLETTGDKWKADQVVVATGAHSTPHVPAFADELPDDVFACHSMEYQDPGQLKSGDVLVVGAGNSGTQIAAEIAADDPDRQVWLAGRDTGRLPRRLLGRDIYRFLKPTLFRVSRHSFVGRHLYQRTADTGDPVFKPEFEKMQTAGVERVGRITGVVDGQPATSEGRRFDVANVIWTTGFRTAFPWIDIDVFEPSGEPRHTRGIVDEVRGLYFIGLPWQHRASSSLVGGVGPDAKHVASHIREAVT